MLEQLWDVQRHLPDWPLGLLLAGTAPGISSVHALVALYTRAGIVEQPDGLDLAALFARAKQVHLRTFGRVNLHSQQGSCGGSSSRATFSPW